MSRCFPYPPPGYSLSRAGKEALIESIKLQKERENAKSQRKKHKKEHKEKKKEKKVKENQSLRTENLCKLEKGLGDLKHEDTEKASQSATQQFEKSSLTEEHGQPISLERPSNSSESTQTSNKRKRHTSTPNGSQGSGNVIRIRLSLQKNAEPDVSAVKEQLCSTSGRVDIKEQKPRSDEVLLVPAVDEDVSRNTELVSEENKLHIKSKKLNKKLERRELKFHDLTENWIPSSRQNDYLGDDDQGWLFGRKRRDVSVEEKPRIINHGMSCSASSMLWPHAQYLQDAEIYALPFTVPF